MPNIRIMFTVIALLLPLFLAPVSGAAQKKNILILNSYHQGYKWTDDETQGAISALEPLRADYKLYIEYMGTKWAFEKPYFEQLRSTYKHKFGRISFDVIIATDNDAFDFLRLYRDEIFGKVPVVFCGVNWFRAEDLHGKTLFTGVNEDADIVKTLEIMLRLHPQTKQIYVIMDATTTGLIVYEKLREIMPLFRKRVTLLPLRDLPMNSILSTVAQAPDNSLVLVTVFQKDRTGTFFEYSESTSLLSGSSRVPLYGLWDFNLGFGIVGGMLTSGHSQGKAAGETALRILRGEKADAIPVLMQGPTRYMFDYTQLQRWQISRSDLPGESVVINEPSSFYSVNKAIVWAVVAGMILLALIVVVLLVNIRQRRIAQAELKKAHDELEIRVQERTSDLMKANMLLNVENKERKRAEEEITKLNSELGEFNNELETLVSERTMNIMALSIADKVRNPVAVIAGTSGRLLGKYELPDKIKESLELVTESAKQLEEIVHDFQALLRSKQSEFRYENLNAIVESIVSVIMREAEAKGIELNTDYAGQPLMINTQQNLLKTAIFHVLKNALEAAQRGGKVKIMTTLEGDKIVLTIRDTGTGIPVEIIDRIFDPFFSTKEHGFGMGLPLVRQVVTEHMGEVQVSSESGKGTTFRLIFPVRWKER